MPYEKIKGKLLVAQGGGPTAVINQSLVGVVLEARKFNRVDLVYGAVHGVRGIVNEDLVNLSSETSHNLEMVANTPSSALGTTRDKPDLKYCQQMLKVMQAHDIRYFCISAATIPPIRRALSAKNPKRRTIGCAVFIFPKR